MIELISDGIVLLDHSPKIDGVILDKLKPQEQIALLWQIEGKCRDRGDVKALEAFGRWRLSHQQGDSTLRPSREADKGVGNLARVGRSAAEARPSWRLGAYGQRGEQPTKA